MTAVLPEDVVGLALVLVAGRSDHQDTAAVTQGTFVQDEVGQLVHDGEGQQPSNAAAEAVRPAHAIDAVGALGAAEHRDRVVIEARRPEVRSGRVRVGRVVDHRHDRPVGIGNEAVGAVGHRGVTRG